MKAMWSMRKLPFQLTAVNLFSCKGLRVSSWGTSAPRMFLVRPGRCSWMLRHTKSGLCVALSLRLESALGRTHVGLLPFSALVKWIAFRMEYGARKDS